MAASNLSPYPTAQTVAALLPKLHDADPDYRFMSLNDLFQVLTFGKPDLLHSDYNTAARTVDGIIKTLDDQNGEVQNLAIKCLAPLVGKLQPAILAPLIDKLSNLTTENSVDNSIPAMALRTVVITLPRPVPGVAESKEVLEAYTAISKVLIPRLLGHVVLQTPRKGTKLPPPPQGMLDVHDSKEIDGETVDVLVEVVRCFGPMLQPSEVEAMQTLVLNILGTERASSVVKKRAVVAISILAIYLSDDFLSAFISQLIEILRNPHLTNTQRRLYITILGSMARSIPTRFGPYLKTLAPFVLSALSEKELSDQLESTTEYGETNQDVDDVREAALVALEAFLAACGGEMRFYTDETISAALRFLKYDPNYNDDDDDEEMGGTQADDDDMNSLDGDDEFDAADDFDNDDDDGSWKVRRCAAKVLYTIIATRGGGDLLDNGTIYNKIAPTLVHRFTEREENVRLEVIAAIASLVRKTNESVIIDHVTNDHLYQGGNAPTSRKRRRASSAATPLDANAALSLASGVASPAVDQTPPSGPSADLAKLTPIIVKSASKLLRSSSVATKQAVLNLLDDIVSAQPGALSKLFDQVVDPLMDAVKVGSDSTGSNQPSAGGAAYATSNTLRIAALRLLADITKTHSSKILQPHLNKIIPTVLAAASDRFYKISSEALGTIEELIKALTPPRSLGMDQSQSPILQKLYAETLSRVAAPDADLEVRQRAIQALGILLARTSTAKDAAHLSVSDRSKGLEVLADRIKNETTRLAAVRAIDDIAAFSTSETQIDHAWIREVAIELSTHLRKANRALRTASLGALRSLIVSKSARQALDRSTIETLHAALLPLLTPTDLHPVASALSIFAVMVSVEPGIVDATLNDAICNLLLSPLSEGIVDSIDVLVTHIGQVGAGQALMDDLLKRVGINGDTAMVGRIIGALLVAARDSLSVSADSFLQELQAAIGDDEKCLALAVLGELGLRLGSKSRLVPGTFMAHFSARSDKVPMAAAIALGRAGAGNPQVFMPEILKTMTTNSSVQYLLLNTIKEVLNQSSTESKDLNAYAKPVWEILIQASQLDDNKAVGAECMGRLAILDPQTYMDKLMQYLSASEASTRSMAIQAIRYTLPDSDTAFDNVLKSNLLTMLTTMMQDTELENRRLALTTINAAAHSKPALLLPNLNRVLPLIMKDTFPNADLMREVQMGPFKHKVDDGLEVRKSAYETLYAILEIAFSRINILEFFDRVIAGLRDEHDIRGLCNIMLTKLVVLDVDETARRLDAIAECFRTILSTKLKDNAVRQEIEKQDEAIKSALRVTLVLHAAIPAASSSLAGAAASAGGQHQIWRGYWEWVEKDFEAKMRELRAESKESAT